MRAGAQLPVIPGCPLKGAGKLKIPGLVLRTIPE